MRWPTEPALAACALALSACAAAPAPTSTDTPQPPPERRADATARQVVATGRVRVLLAHRAAAALALEEASGMGVDSPRERDALAAEQIVREVGAVTHPDVRALVDRVQGRVGGRCDAPEGWSVTVLDTPDEANAASLPSGQVFVSSGLILSTRDEAELAAVVAHELGHVTAQHARAHGLVARGGVALSAAGMGLDQADASVSTVGGLGGEVVLGEHARAQEIEADRRAALCLARAGYDPDALIDLIDRQRGVAPRLLENLERSHPSDARRARALRSARAAGVFTSGGERGDEPAHEQALVALRNL
jgi:predicted Zn-dependent protease